MKAYLERLQLERALDLPELMRAHLQHVPFENLSVLAGRPIRLDLESLERKLLLERQGGYCFEHNTLFEHVLLQLDYQVTPLQARVRRGVHELRPHTHKLLRVLWQGQDHLVDVGFGGEGVSQPLPWVPNQEHEFYPGVFHRLVREDDLWVLQCRHDGDDWLDLYATENRRTYPVDDEMGNWYTSTFPGSLFRKSMLISLHHAGGTPVSSTVCSNTEKMARPPLASSSPRKSPGCWPSDSNSECEITNNASPTSGSLRQVPHLPRFRIRGPTGRHP